MAQLWTTGPALIYVGANASSTGSALFLGTCEEKPDADIVEEWYPALNDLGGKVPIDKCRGGQKVDIVLDLTRWNEPPYVALGNPQPSSALLGISPGPRGNIVGGQQGMLMATEGENFYLYMIFPYAAKLAYAGMPPGYRFLNCSVNRESLISLGTKPRKVRLVIEALPYLTISPGQLGGFSLPLYDFAVGGMPAPN